MLGTILAQSVSNYSAAGSLFAFGGLGISLIIGLISIIFNLVIFGLIMAGLILWIVMLIDVIQRKDDEFPNASKDSKMLWLLIILLTSYIGGLIYYFLVYKKLPRSKSTVEKK